MPDPQPKPTSPLAAWRKALADHNRQQRNRRGKRPAKPITGIRKPTEGRP